MKLHQAVAADRNQFTGYGAGYVAVNQQRYERSIVVTPEAIHDAWHVADVDALNSDAVRYLLELKPEIVLMGTGASQRFPQGAIMREFAMAQVGVEIMDTPAACRTFNILMAEGREVIAAVMV